jgi:hypothetical protein
LGTMLPIRAHPQTGVKIALRAKFFRRDEDAPAGAERPRKGNGPVGRIAVKRDVHAPRFAEQRQPCRLPAAGPVESARAGAPDPGRENRQRIGNAS